ncbi:MAG: hypothetical protein JJW01_00065 [Alphaproteobacteria bacterium]|nr:hypothetical protein [Rickettsiales bacterium]
MYSFLLEISIIIILLYKNIHFSFASTILYHVVVAFLLVSHNNASFAEKTEQESFLDIVTSNVDVKQKDYRMTIANTKGFAGNQDNLESFKNMITQNKDMSFILCAISKGDFAIWKKTSNIINIGTNNDKRILVLIKSKCRNNILDISQEIGSVGIIEVCQSYHSIVNKLDKNEADIIIIPSDLALKLILNREDLQYRDMSIDAGCNWKNGKINISIQKKRKLKTVNGKIENFFKTFHLV